MRLSEALDGALLQHEPVAFQRHQVGPDSVVGQGKFGRQVVHRKTAFSQKQDYPPPRAFEKSLVQLRGAHIPLRHAEL